MNVPCALTVPILEEIQIKHTPSPLAIECGQGGILLYRRLPIFYNALLLTAVNLLLRMAGTSFQVYISSRIGAAGVGLLQLVMSVSSLSMVAGMAGIRTATMYLTAEELGKKRAQNVTWVLSACFLYSICFSTAVGGLVFFSAPLIARYWIGAMEAVQALRIFAAFLPCTCLCGVLTGYFTGANRIRTLAVVEVVEQVCSMLVTLAALTFWAGEDSARACQAVVLGGCLGGIVTLLLLTLLRILERPVHGPRIPVRRRLEQVALPLALADIVKSGINTTENLMVPQRLARNPMIDNPLAAFGLVCGMVFPVLMFPACILFGLAELLIPELARCAAGGSKKRISHLVQRSLWVAMLYGTTFSCLIYLLSEDLCQWLYQSQEAGYYLRMYAPLIPMLYCDAITDAMTKGLGQQKICVRYNILTSALDVVFLYFLLPRFGMRGYFFSFLVTHLINFILSLRRLLIISGEHISAALPLFTGVAALGSCWAVSHLSSPALQAVTFLPLFLSLLYLMGVFKKEDFAWLKGLLSPKPV